MSRLNFRTSEWDHGLPQLNETRVNCSACYLQEWLYVVGGLKNNSVERLDLSSESISSSSEAKAWEVLTFPVEVFSPRYWSAVSVLNSAEIAIIGGRARKGKNHGNLGEIFVLNVNTGALQKASKDDGEVSVVTRNN